MKLKSFREHMEKRLTKQDIAEIERQAELEVRALRSLQEGIKKIMEDYVKKNKIGFNELVERLESNPRQVAKIQKGEANLTLASIAHIAALLGQEPVIVFKKRS